MDSGGEKQALPELMLEDGMCFDDLEKFNLLSRDDKIEFVRKKIEVLKNIISQHDEFKETVWEIINTPKKEVSEYYQKLSVLAVDLRSPVLGELYRINRLAFIAFRW